MLSLFRCIRCNWPVCSLKCQDSPMHDAECRATKAAGSRIKVEVFGQVRLIKFYWKLKNDKNQR